MMANVPQWQRINKLIFAENDLVIVGVPVYKGRVPVVYGNRDYDDALLELKDTFEGNGFIGVKSIKHELYVKITQGLIDNFSAIRNEPELFIMDPGIETRFSRG